MCNGVNRPVPTNCGPICNHNDTVTRHPLDAGAAAAAASAGWLRSRSIGSATASLSTTTRQLRFAPYVFSPSSLRFHLRNKAAAAAAVADSTAATLPAAPHTAAHAAARAEAFAPWQQRKFALHPASSRFRLTPTSTSLPFQSTNKQTASLHHYNQASRRWPRFPPLRQPQLRRR